MLSLKLQSSGQEVVNITRANKLAPASELLFFFSNTDFLFVPVSARAAGERERAATTQTFMPSDRLIPFFLSRN